MSLKKFFKPTEQTALKSSKANINVSGSEDFKTLADLKQKSDFDKKVFAFVDQAKLLIMFDKLIESPELLPTRGRIRGVELKFSLLVFINA